MSDEIVSQFPKFIKDINLIQPEYNLCDRVWRFPMRFGPNPKDWTIVHVALYENTYYCNWTEWDLSLELSKKGKINYMWEANLQEAKLEKANLQKAKLKEAKLQEADLEDANLQQANLVGLIYRMQLL